ncbi:Soma ferritin [Astathelohania contejeani]|uniref:Ferritin n=1 Tax=Astathelohania contejeani TaxID=164912 RepID=A0ABQ7I2F7_9MICR|nr:Soma ferritin [Thelohania contejeani]
MKNQNITDEQKIKIENYLNSQLNLEYKAFYFYQFCMAYFNQHDIALPGLTQFFENMAFEELTHAKGIIDYMNKCFFEVKFRPISTGCDILENVNDVFKKSVEFEIQVYNHILEIYNYCENIGDRATTIFLDPYVKEQIDSIKELNDLHINAKRCIGGSEKLLGLFIYDNSFNTKNKFK